MNEITLPSVVEPTPGLVPALVTRALSNKQVKAATIANERLAQKRWKIMLPEARAAWTKVPPEDLTRVNGNIHVLAGLIQLRYHTTRQDADQQVQQFLLAHPHAAEPAAAA